MRHNTSDLLIARDIKKRDLLVTGAAGVESSNPYAVHESEIFKLFAKRKTATREATEVTATMSNSRELHFVFNAIS